MSALKAALLFVRDQLLLADRALDREDDDGAVMELQLAVDRLRDVLDDLRKVAA